MTRRFTINGELEAGDVSRLVSGTLTIAAGASGTILTITPTSSLRRVRLTFLGMATSPEPGVTVRVAGNDVVDSKTLAAAAATQVNDGQFAVGIAEQGATLFIQGALGETIEVVKDSGSTGNALLYGYEELE